MDVNSIDPGADEAVQRIQTSLNRIDTRAEAHKEAQKNPDALAGMLGQLAASARLDTQNSEMYQKLAAQENVTGLLSEAVHEMTAIAIATSAVLRDKHGINVDRPGYKLLKSLAGHNETLSEEAKALNDPNWSARGLWEIERTLRGTPNVTEAQAAEHDVDNRAAAAAKKVIKDYYESDAGSHIKSVFDEGTAEDSEEAPYDPDGNWLKYMSADQIKAVEEEPAQKPVTKPVPTFEEEWKMPNRGGW